MPATVLFLPRGRRVGAVELGRRDPARKPPEPLHAAIPIDGGTRFAIAEGSEGDISRRQVRIERLAGGALRIENLSTGVSLRCDGRPPVPPGRLAEYPLPVVLPWGRFTIAVGSNAGVLVAPHEELRTLDERTSFLPSPTSFIDGGLSRDVAALPPATAASLVRWWRNVIAVLQSAPSSDQFFHRVVESPVKLFGLDLGAVYLHEGGEGRLAVGSTTRS